MLRCLFACLLAFGLCGCASMQVNKITQCDRMTGAEDHIKGFRYYLARPYVVVKKRVEVSRQVSLIAIDTRHASWAKSFVQKYDQNPADALALVPHQYVKRCESTSEAFEAVSAAEWEAMKNQLRPATAEVAQASHTAAEKVNRSTLSHANNAAAMPTATSVPLYAQVSENTANYENESRPNQPLKDAECQTLAGPSVTLSGDIDVVFLPDMDEQYAVHNRNFLSKSSYNLQFKDGWQLAAVNGEFDSTTVAIEVLNTIDSAVQAAKTVATARLPLRYPKPPAKAPADNAALLPDPEHPVIFLEAETITYLRPGIYRVNKPWEMEGGVPNGHGLLAQMGLPTVTDSTVKPSTTRQSQPALIQD